MHKRGLTVTGSPKFLRASSISEGVQRCTSVLRNIFRLPLKAEFI